MSGGNLHGNRFGNHHALAHLRCITPPRSDALENGPIDEAAQWAIYDVQALSFAVRFVLVAATSQMWAKGYDIFSANLHALILNTTDLGLPSSVKPFPFPGSTRSIWILQTPERSYQWIVFDPKQGIVTWHPIFSIDPLKAAGSVDALRLLFPVNSDDGIDALETHFWNLNPITTNAV